MLAQKEYHAGTEGIRLHVTVMILLPRDKLVRIQSRGPSHGMVLSRGALDNVTRPHVKASVAAN